ncbi:hypothetical protein RJ640_011248 [Escallonia rubra]|uniref:Terpene synthase metal-binding domain-containing protein n=1 Tax=Escallonia rubra TaxID=112253 RepID=A0AA88SEE4_9ASTE|nr:hypothetical protein RJ640_011248 [Escallonia rubra]
MTSSAASSTASTSTTLILIGVVFPLVDIHLGLKSLLDRLFVPPFDFVLMDLQFARELIDRHSLGVIGLLDSNNYMVEFWIERSKDLLDHPTIYHLFTISFKLINFQQYEASFLGYDEETLLDEAKSYAKVHLKDVKNYTGTGLREEVYHALELPFHQRMQRLEARWYIDAYIKKEDANHLLLELATLDFNMVQAAHQKDLQHVSRRNSNAMVELTETAPGCQMDESGTSNSSVVNADGGSSNAGDEDSCSMRAGDAFAFDFAVQTILNELRTGKKPTPEAPLPGQQHPQGEAPVRYPTSSLGRGSQKWWKSLGLPSNLSFIRDRLMECFFWTVGVASEPHFRTCRIGLTKVTALITTIDDVYDVYGSLDELQLFTEAIERWDINAVEHLPHYMKFCFLALYNTVNEMAYDTLKEQGVYSLPILTNMWKDMCQAFLVEAKWNYNKYTPTLDDYLDNAWRSVSGVVILGHVYFLTSRNVTQEEMECLQNNQDLLKWSSMIFRLCNDLGTSTAEIERGETANSIRCYMTETGLSEELAREHIKSLVDEAWKKMNKYLVDDSPFARTFIERAINLARIAQCTYQYGDGHGAPDTRSKNRITSLIIEPITPAQRERSFGKSKRFLSTARACGI